MLKMKEIHICVAAVLSVGLMYIGDKFGTTNIWITAAAIISVYFLIELLCWLHLKFQTNKCLEDDSKSEKSEHVNSCTRQQNIDIPVDVDTEECDNDSEINNNNESITGPARKTPTKRK